MGEGKEPTPGMEYIIVRDFERPDVKQGSIAINVVRQKDGDHSYHFLVKGTGKGGSIWYPWAFVENTPKGRKMLKKYWKLWDDRDKLNAKISKMCNELPTLKDR